MIEASEPAKGFPAQRDGLHRMLRRAGIAGQGTHRIVYQSFGAYSRAAIAVWLPKKFCRALLDVMNHF